MNLYMIFDGTESVWDSTTIAIISAESQEQAEALAKEQSLYGTVQLLEPSAEAKIHCSFERAGQDSNPGGWGCDSCSGDY